jgi:NADPH-dependent 2,4-dienoyl-CoA reductase/sulfur reductase-like enzyme
MHKNKILIVGGVAGGAAAAARIRRNDEFANIVMVERGAYISFANCGLPYYVGGVIDSRDKLLVQTPERMKARYNIDVRVNNEVLKISPKEKKAAIKDLTSGEEYEESYDYLLLSPGAAPIYTDPALADNDSVFTLKTIGDADKVIAAIDSGAKSAVVVGGGFIGIEAARIFMKRALT